MHGPLPTHRCKSVTRVPLLTMFGVALACMCTACAQFITPCSSKPCTPPHCMPLLRHLLPLSSATTVSPESRADAYGGHHVTHHGRSSFQQRCKGAADVQAAAALASGAWTRAQPAITHAFEACKAVMHPLHPPSLHHHPHSPVPVCLAQTAPPQHAPLGLSRLWDPPAHAA
jgi:hypothetical protein